MRKSAVDENSHLHNIKYRIKGAAAAGCSFSVLICLINGKLSACSFIYVLT